MFQYAHSSYPIILRFICSFWICLQSVTQINAQTLVLNGASTSISYLTQISVQDLEIPVSKNHDQIIHHTAYTLSYNERHEQANWVAYKLNNAKTMKRVNRSNEFEPDAAVKTGSANDHDYLHSGYDRGHLAPAADMAWSEKSMVESFYYSNMSPQVPSFNRGIWKQLESQVRNWASTDQELYIVTGPILTEHLPTIGENKVSVPKAYYKAILSIEANELNAIAFLLPNEASHLPIPHFSISIDSLEQLSGIDFFDKLPDEIETNLENTICLPCWKWEEQHSSKQIHERNRIETEHLEHAQKVQCNASTKSGSRCKRTTTNVSGRCYQHE